MKFGTRIALIKGLKVNISGFGKIQYGRHFFIFSDFLNYDLLYLGNYSTDLNEIWHTYSTYKGH